jgi:formylglycine-generating enzyme required for sulfatase activity/Flp pilus assembly protein TadD
MPVQVLCPNPRCGVALSGTSAELAGLERCPRCGQPLAASSAPCGTPQTLAPALAAGASFGRYRIERTLGHGEMGSVYLAHDTVLDRLVALKIPYIPPGSGPEVLERFYREARAAAALDHPNLCPVYDVGDVDGTPYLTMAYIDGRPLSQLIGHERALPQRQVAAVIRKLAVALQEAHDRGVVHRDLKPANVLVSRKRDLVIVDFGLARRDDGGDARLTQSGMILGTPAYMAPEQVVGDLGAIGPASDIYALGVILYEMLTGKVPFEGSAALVLGRILAAESEAISAVRPDVEPRLEAICGKAMAKESGSRYGSMRELAEALGEYLRGGPEAVAPAAAIPPPIPVGDQPPASVAAGLETLIGRFVDRFGSRVSRGPLPIRPEATAEAPASAGRPRRPVVRPALLGAGAAALLALLGAVIYVVTDMGTVKIELSDPEAEAVVKVDGKSISVEGLGAPLRLRVGEHELEVVGEAFEGHGRKFAIKRGEAVTIRVELVAKANISALVASRNAGNGATPTSGGREVTGEPGRSGAPGGAEVARRGADSRVDESTSADPANPTARAGAGATADAARIVMPTDINASSDDPELRQAIAARREELNRNPDDPQIRNRLAASLSENGETDEAMTHIAEALRLRPDFPQAHNNMAFALVIHRDSARRDPALALQHARRAVSLLPDDGSLQNTLGVAELHNGNPGAAEAALRKSMEIGGGSPYDWFPMATLCARNGRGDEAGRWFEKAVESIRKNGGRFKADLRPLWIEAAEELRGRRWSESDAKDASPQGAKPSAPSPTDGFRPLFSGKDLTGWKLFPGEPNNWRVERGHLIGSGPWSNLFTERGDYRNFHLRVEARIPGGSNSGIIFRAPFRAGFAGAYEAEINSTDLADDQRTGSLRHYAPFREAIVRPGDWYTHEVIADGNHITIKVNGRTTADFVDPRVSYTNGHIALQQLRDGSTVEFRRVEVKELPDSADPVPTAGVGSTRFFNGKDLSGWEGLPEYWRVADGAIVGTCPPGQKAYTFLCSTRTYTNFELRFKARLLDGVGNSGVQFRSWLADRKGFGVQGPQCEVGENIAEFPPGSLVTEPSVQPAIAADRDRIKIYKPNDFNEFAILCVDKQVDIWVNGFQVVHGIFPSMPAQGIIAWQIHGGDTPREVDFKEITLIDLSRPARGDGTQPRTALQPGKAGSAPKSTITTVVGPIKLKRIPAGSFLMGAAPDENDSNAVPQHEVRITRPFYLGVHEVTQAQYRAVTGHNPSFFSSTGEGKDLVSGATTDQHPVERVTWFDAVRYCNALSEREDLKPFYEIAGDRVRVPDWSGTGYRLPTEAEWEYARRAGSLAAWHLPGDNAGGVRWSNYAWLAPGGGRSTHPVGKKRPNGHGLYDMAGNVAEWCWDWIGPYPEGSSDDPVRSEPVSGAFRVARGGCFGQDLWNCRAAKRGGIPPGFSDQYTGFRIARTCL